MLVLTFSWKKLFHIYFFIVFFLIMLENPASPSSNFSSPMKNSSKGRFSHVAPSPQPPRTKNRPEKVCIHFQIIITVCKRWSKFVTCSPSPGDCGGVSQPQRHSYYVFRPCWTKWLSQNFDPLTLGKNERGRGPRCPPIFWSFKMGTRTFNFR